MSEPTVSLDTVLEPTNSQAVPKETLQLQTTETNTPGVNFSSFFIDSITIIFQLALKRALTFVSYY